MAEKQVDVFICGAGPVGLVLAYQLNRLGVSTHIVDAADKASPDMPMYGRASTLAPRTQELLDALDLFDDLAQEALLSNRSFTYSNGERVAGRGWTYFQQKNPDTFFHTHLNLRLKFSEDIFRARLAELGSFVQAPVRLTAFTLDQNAKEDYQVLATCKGHQEETYQVKAKYIVGTDGGGSTVRKLGQIPFPGDNKDVHWVRIDGIVKTNIPEARCGFGTFETSSHGHVLWAALDHGATRIGYVLTKALFEKYGYQMTQEEAIYEAKLACAPFEVEFLETHWHTVYGIQQHVAETLVDRGRVILAGDAAHTHSSGTAQGMNTGMHDVSNLGWRLAGEINGWYRHGVLQNYSDERHAVAEQLIKNDKTISMLMSGVKPDHMKSRPESHMVLLGEFMQSTLTFSNGLGISYGASLINDVEHAFEPVKIRPGHRAPDALINKQGFRQLPIRFLEVVKNNGKFKVVVFTAKADLTRKQLKSLRAQIDAHQARFAHAIDFVTIVEGIDQAFDEHLGVRKLGRGYWDIQSNAHYEYGLGENIGALLVLRPDGIVAASAPLDGFEAVVVPYLSRIVVERATVKQTAQGDVGFGELLNPFENNLKFSARNAQVV